MSPLRYASGVVALRERVRALRWLNPAARVGLGLLMLLAVVAGGFSWHVEPFLSVERQLYDLRVSAFPETAEPDDRILMIAYTDETMFATGRIAPVDRALLVRALVALRPMGARTIAIDLPLDIPQDSDGQLVEALRALDVPLYMSVGDDPMRHAQSLITRAGIADEHLVSMAFHVDGDGVVRDWPAAEQGGRPLLAHALSDNRFGDYRGPIRFRAPVDPDQPVIPTLPIELVGDAAVAPMLADMVRGRHVLIGIDSSRVDRVQTPLIYSQNDPQSGWYAGLQLQANMLSQALDGQRYWKPPIWFPPLLPLLILPLAMLTAALAMPRWLRAILIIGQLAWLVIIPFAVEYLYEDSAGVGAFGWVLCWLLGFGAVHLIRRAKAWEQGRIAQSALTRYLPPEIAEQIINDPTRLALNGQRCQVFALFSDLEGFTALCQSEAPDEIATFLNDYLETLSQVVLDHGGTIDKFVGDAVVAFWGAPLAREDDGERAARAAVAIHEAGEMFRSRLLPAGGRVGRTRVGLHYGEAIVGNFGGDGRIQYTALGDTMNLAARLENANKQLGTSILLSREAAAFASGIVLRTMGRIVVRGRTTPVAVMEPGIGIEAVDVERMNNLYEAALAGDAQAREELAAWASDRKFDLGLARLVERLDDAGTDGATRLR